MAEPVDWTEGGGDVHDFFADNAQHAGPGSPLHVPVRPSQNRRPATTLKPQKDRSTASRRLKPQSPVAVRGRGRRGRFHPLHAPSTETSSQPSSASANQHYRHDVYANTSPGQQSPGNMSLQDAAFDQHSLHLFTNHSSQPIPDNPTGRLGAFPASTTSAPDMITLERPANPLDVSRHVILDSLYLEGSDKGLKPTRFVLDLNADTAIINPSKVSDLRLDIRDYPATPPIYQALGHYFFFKAFAKIKACYMGCLEPFEFKMLPVMESDWYFTTPGVDGVLGLTALRKMIKQWPSFENVLRNCGLPEDQIQRIKVDDHSQISIQTPFQNSHLENYARPQLASDAGTAFTSFTPSSTPSMTYDCTPSCSDLCPDIFGSLGLNPIMGFYNANTTHVPSEGILTSADYPLDAGGDPTFAPLDLQSSFASTIPPTGLSQRLLLEQQQQQQQQHPDAARDDALGWPTSTYR